MTNRTMLCALAIAMIALGASPMIAADEKPARQPTTTTVELMSLLRWAVGEWTLEGNWANGNSIRARAVYEAGPADAFVQVRTYVRDAEGREGLRDVVIYGLRDGKLVQWTFGQDGTVREVAATPTEDGSLFFEWTKPGSNGKPAIELRQRFTRLPDDRLRWQTFMLSKGEWHQVISGDFERTAAR
jgi:hypothetical protein